ncbi:hypothetical protein PENCOP_c017G06616 [Penicillium coprophilum]|uniref:Uncharacterized protein n=1 Tax=Penicillium coprophilum TaxID=36646 RepID=A0A1V6U7P2_9EURO|nr:hypothetical protein PENCOP_c017G06616 [Penicillium coprophilum]
MPLSNLKKLASKNPKDTNDVHPPNGINASTEIEGNPEGVTTPVEKMALILEEATQIVEEFGLKIGSDGAAKNQL